MSFPHFTSSELASLVRRDLQKLCKRSDVAEWASVHRPQLKANAKNADLLEALTAFFEQAQTEAMNDTVPEQQVEVVEQKEDEVMVDVEPVVQAAATVIPAEPAIITSNPTPKAATSQPIIAEPELITFLPAPSNTIIPPASDNEPLSTSIPSAEDFPELVADDEEEQPVMMQDDEDAELMQLEAEIEVMEAKMAEPVKKSSASTINKKKSMAPSTIKKTAAAVTAVKSKSTKKVAPIVAASSKKSLAPVASPVVAAPLFTRKPTNKKKSLAVAAIKKVANLAAANEAQAAVATSSATTTTVVPPPNSFASAFTLPASFPVVESSSSTATSAAAASSSSSSSANDGYWSLMAELDKRVGEKKKIEVETGVIDPAFIPTVTATSTAQIKKTASKFDAIHKKAAAKTESIVEYQERLDAKKRQAQAISTPLIGNKRHKTMHGLPAASPIALETVAEPFTLPQSSPSAAAVGGFTAGRKTLPAMTPGIAKRTRASLKKESEKKINPVKSTKLAFSQITKRKTIMNAPKEDLPKASPVAPVKSSSIPIAKKFDLSASLAKPLTWKPHKGKIPRETKTATAVTKEKENQVPMDLSETVVTQPFKIDGAFTMSEIKVTENMFVAKPAATTAATTGLFERQQPKASVQRDHIKTIKMGVDKDTKIARRHLATSNTRNRLLQEARFKNTGVTA